MRRMHDRDRLRVGFLFIMDLPGISRHFKHDGILWRNRLFDPYLCGSLLQTQIRASLLGSQLSHASRPPNTITNLPKGISIWLRRTQTQRPRDTRPCSLNTKSVSQNVPGRDSQASLQT